jgi:hypothetical protein
MRARGSRACPCVPTVCCLRSLTHNLSVLTEYPCSTHEMTNTTPGRCLMRWLVGLAWVSGSVWCCLRPRAAHAEADLGFGRGVEARSGAAPARARCVPAVCAQVLQSCTAPPLWRQRGGASSGRQRPAHLRHPARRVHAGHVPVLRAAPWCAAVHVRTDTPHGAILGAIAITAICAQTRCMCFSSCCRRPPSQH